MPGGFPLRHAPPLAILLLALALAAGPASATRQDPASYPDGVAKVSNTPIDGGTDFQVTVMADPAPDSVTVTVCRFSSAAAPSPDVCFMNLAAAASGDGFVADTGAVKHPSWHDGWVLGYKVTLASGGAEAHAPDRTTSTGEQDYYRIVVGSAQDDPAPQGSAEVVDDAPAAEPAAASDAPAQVHPAGMAPVSAALALACALALARRR